MAKGFIKIYREIEEDIIWSSDEPFCRRAAWIDLIMMANHVDKEILVGSQKIVIKRGQRFTSIRKLSERWNWSPKRTLAFLRLLEEDGKIYRTKMCNATLLTIVKYDKFQDSGNTKVHTSDSTGVSTGVHTRVPQTRMIKNDIKNDLKNEKEKSDF